MTDQGNALPPPQDRPTMAELAGRDPRGGRVQICPNPACGKRLFRVKQTWYLRDGTKRRGYKCANCGHVDTSSVTEVFDGDEQEEITGH